MDASNNNITIQSGGDLTFDAITFYRVPVHTILGHAVAVRRCLFTLTQAEDAIELRSSIGSVVLDSNAFNRRNVTIRSYDGGDDAPPLEWDVIKPTFENTQNVS